MLERHAFLLPKRTRFGLSHARFQKRIKMADCSSLCRPEVLDLGNGAVAEKSPQMF